MNKRIMRIFVDIPYIGLIELKNDANFIFDKPCYDWINSNNIEDYKFIDISHEGIEYKIPITDFKFMY